MKLRLKARATVAALTFAALAATTGTASADWSCSGGTGCNHQTGILFNGATFTTGTTQTFEWWGPYTVLKMQTDGNLVLYCQNNGVVGSPVWATNTWHSAPSWDDGWDGGRVGFETDGKIYVWWTYDLGTPGASTSDEWSSSPGGGYEAIVQADGNFVTYNSAGTALWASGTYHACPGTAAYYG